jgi:hypothetical protein
LLYSSYGIDITTLKSGEWELFKELRLKAIRSNPEAFGLSLKTALKITD